MRRRTGGWFAMNARDWGAFTLGVSATNPIDLADAYATLAADGTHCDPLPVREVAGGDGRPVPAAGPHCAAVLRPEVARAAMDAGRCPVGDRSAVGDVCGAPAPAAAVRGIVGRPVAGQFGASEQGSVALAVAGPQLVTVGLGNPAPCGCAAPTGTLSAPLVQAVAGTEHDGLAGLPDTGFPPPPALLAHG